jgi:hypothetical protein
MTIDIFLRHVPGRVVAAERLTRCISQAHELEQIVVRWLHQKCDSVQVTTDLCPKIQQPLLV